MRIYMPSADVLHYLESVHNHTVFLLRFTYGDVKSPSVFKNVITNDVYCQQTEQLVWWYTVFDFMGLYYFGLHFDMFKLSCYGGW